MGGRVVSREGGKLSIRASIPRAVVMAFGSALLAAGSGAVCVAWFVTLPEQVAEMSLLLLIVTRLVTLPILLVCLVGLLLFGWGLIFFLGQLLFFWRPIFEVGPEGILDEASSVGVGFVPWEEIEDVRPFEFGGQRSITIRVKNEQELLKRQNPVKRLLIRINRKHFGSGQINVPLNVLAIPDEELAAEIVRRLGPQGEAGEKLRPESGEDGPEAGMPGGKRRSESTRALLALRIAKSVVRWISVVVLSVFYYVFCVGLVFPGLIFLWNGIGPGSSPEFDHPVIGAILLVLGILVFIFFPRVVKKLTGREVLSTPYS